MRIFKNRGLWYFVVLVLMVGCKGEEGPMGPSGLNSLIQTSNEPAGTNCEHGGLKVESGLDVNANDILDANEVRKTDYVCSKGGSNSLINMDNEPAGAICRNGGLKIESGVDKDGDGVLETDEIEMTRYLCNGLDGGFDEQIRIPFFEGNYSVTGNDTLTLGGTLVDFDKSYFPGVDSIVYMVFGIRTSYPEGNNKADLTIELYDLTNKKLIPNGKIVSDDTGGDSEVKNFASSGNVINSLPNGSFRLGLRLSVQEPKAVAGFGPTVLVLYRNP